MNTKHAMRAWSMAMSAQKLSQRTITERTSVVVRLAEAADVEATEICPEDIIAFIGSPALSRSSAATYLAHVRAFCAWCVVSGIRDDDPTMLVPKPRRSRGTPRPISTEERARVLSIVNRRKTRAMVYLGLFAGLRAHEIAKFRGEDIDREAAQITVTGKGGDTQIIPLHERIAEIADQFPSQGWWFPSPAGPGPVDRRHVSSTIGRLFRRAGIPRGGPHRLRHWYGSELLQQGVDIRVVQELMRHESIQSTQIYTKVDDRQRTAAIALLPS